MGHPDRRTARLAAPAILGLIGFLVLVLVASGGPVHVWHDPPPTKVRVPAAAADEPSDPASVTQGTLPPVTDNAPDNSWITGVALVLVLLIVGYVLYVIITTLPRLRPRRPLRDEISDRHLQPLPSLDPPDVELDEAAGLAALETGTPRNAIVACWLQMEHDVARAGMPKDPSETSTEYTSRVLRASSLDSTAVQTLAALYREARFSSHEIGSRHRDAALSALRRIHASLPARR